MAFSASKGGNIIIESSKVSQVWVYPFSSVNIINSIIYSSILLGFTGENEDIELSGLMPNQTIPSLYFQFGRGILMLRNSQVSSWQIDLTYHFEKSLTIRDSCLDLIQLNFDEVVNIRNIKPGYFNNWNIHKNVLGHTLWNLTLFNVTIDGWKLITLNDAYIENCEVLLNPWMAEAQNI